MSLGILMVLVAFPMAWFIKDNPEDATLAEKRESPKVPFKNILKQWSFYLLLIGSFCSIGAVAGTGQNLKLFLSIDLKYSQQDAANIMSIVLGASIIGRLLMGWLADRMQKKYVMTLTYALVAISIPLLFAADTKAFVYVFAFLFGIALGGDYMIIPLMAAELFGVKVMGRVMGLIISADGVGEAFGPMLAAWLRDKTGSYVYGFSALIILAVIGTIAVLLLPTQKKGPQLPEPSASPVVKLLFAEDIGTREFLCGLGFEFIFRRPDHRDVLHSQIGEQPFQQTAFLRVEIAFCLFLDHCQNVKPVFACFKVEAPLPGRGMRNGAQRSGGVRRKRRKEINKTRRVFGSGDLFARVGHVRDIIIAELT